MMRLLRNLLHQDTRAVELPSALALVAIGVLGFAFGGATSNVLTDYPQQFLTMFALVVGGLQLYSLIDYDRSEPLRTVIAWVAGSFWMMEGSSHLNDASGILCFALGLSNIVAFVINTVILSERWKR